VISVETNLQTPARRLFRSREKPLETIAKARKMRPFDFGPRS
jgi:hypothetical protein